MSEKKCSFCGKSEKNIKLIEQEGAACICFDCVKKFKQELDETNQGE
jgi:ATP-dependent protease Clp ATPase subunit